MFAVTLLALGACDFQLEDDSGSANNNGDGGSGPPVTATVVANTKMTAIIIDNFSGTNANGAHASIPQGTDLTNASLTAANSLGDTATGTFSLKTSGGSVVFTIKDDGVCRGVAMIAGVGKNQTPNNHQALITLFTDEPVTGLLTVTLDGQASSLAGSGFTTIDVGNDGDPDFQTPNLQGTYEETLSFDSTFEIRTETVTQVENINTISRTITLTFVPSETSDFDNGGGHAAPAGVGRPLATPLDFGVEGDSAIERPGTRWAPGAPTARLRSYDEGAGATIHDSGRAAQVGTIPGTYEWSRDCNLNGLLDSDEIAGGALDCDGDGALDECQVRVDPSLDWNGDGVLDVCRSPNYCTANSHGGGLSGFMELDGSPRVSDNDFTLIARDLPANELGFFLMSESQDFVPLFGGSQGNLCLGIPVVRLSEQVAGGVLNSGPDGVFTFSLDLTDLRQLAVLKPGDLWYFQAWFRDQQESYTSDGIEVMFR